MADSGVGGYRNGPFSEAPGLSGPDGAGGGGGTPVSLGSAQGLWGLGGTGGSHCYYSHCTGGDLRSREGDSEAHSLAVPHLFLPTHFRPHPLSIAEVSPSQQVLIFSSLPMLPPLGQNETKSYGRSSSV